ncbi:MAG: L,D-transpeptidase [Opitutaceae bacterium]|nr:L,D-transpeptidase [Opitutaceae bacterium]
MKASDRLGIKPTDRILVVRLASQTLQFFYRNSLTRSYSVSTSRRPPSNIAHSLGTPSGLHEIAERIGGGQPSGMVFKARLPTGRHYTEYASDELVTDDLITSRILWLKGLEPGINAGGNVDTYSRYIYIHGTRHEDKLGTPASAGCIRMSNGDVIALYDEVRAGDWVWIGD